MLLLFTLKMGTKVSRYAATIASNSRLPKAAKGPALEGLARVGF
jgi:hypothetical protein